jgi:Type II CAAX prenyl endopeptidase Rce1-like
MPSFVKAFVLGLPGILAVILTVTPPAGVPAILLAVNPLLFLVVGAIAGAWAAPKAGLRSAIILGDAFAGQIVLGFAVSGLAAGLSIAFVDHLAAPLWNSGTLRTLREQGALQHLPVGIFYGGVTEEIIFRWGSMALLVAGAMKVFSREPAIWIGVVLSALLFAAAHLPAVALEAGTLTVGLSVRTLIWNILLGLLFGVAFARGGLEAAMVAHVGFHLAVAAANNL